MADGQQVKNGKAFEYAIAKEYYNFLSEQSVNVKIEEDSSFHNAEKYYLDFAKENQNRFDIAASATIASITKLEPGLVSQKNSTDCLTIRIAADSEGQGGDVRDVIFNRAKPHWEIGFSAKNNNDAVKHSRLGRSLDFGNKWLGVPVSQQYWESIRPIFEYIEQIICDNPDCCWSDLGNSKQMNIYIPLLTAFRDELLRISQNNDDIPNKLVSYLIGDFPFYKIIKDDAHQLVVVKAFNINGELNKTVNGVKSRYSTPIIKLPKRIVEFEFKENSQDTLCMILDGGWEISFRIHNASSKIERSLKFDIQLLGNPPILFTQHIFQ